MDKVCRLALKEKLFFSKYAQVRTTTWRVFHLSFFFFFSRVGTWQEQLFLLLKFKMGGCQVTSRCSNRNKRSACRLYGCEHVSKSNEFNAHCDALHAPTSYQTLHMFVPTSEKRSATHDALRGRRTTRSDGEI